MPGWSIAHEMWSLQPSPQAGVSPARRVGLGPPSDSSRQVTHRHASQKTSNPRNAHSQLRWCDAICVICGQSGMLRFCDGAMKSAMDPSALSAVSPFAMYAMESVSIRLIRGLPRPCDVLATSSCLGVFVVATAGSADHVVPNLPKSSASSAASSPSQGSPEARQSKTIFAALSRTLIRSSAVDGSGAWAMQP